MALAMMGRVILTDTDPPPPTKWLVGIATAPRFGIALAQGYGQQGAEPIGESVERIVPAATIRSRVNAAFGSIACRMGAPLCQLQLADCGVDLVWANVPDRDAIELLLIGKVEFAVVGSNLSDHDTSAGLQSTVLGAELWSLIVAEDCPLTSLTSQQVRLALTGQLRDWRDLGLPFGPLRVIAITDHGVCERAAGALMPGDALLESAPQVADDQDVVNQVLTAPGSLGLVRASTVEEGAKVRLLRIDGTLPTTKEFAFGRYRASSPLVVATRGPAQGAALQYIEAARKAPAARGFSPLQ